MRAEGFYLIILPRSPHPKIITLTNNYRKGNMSSKHILEMRREKVKRYIAQGLTKTEIAKKLKIARPTLDFDIRAITKEIKKIINKQPIEQFLLEFVSNYDEIGRELWDTYKRSKKTKKT